MNLESARAQGVAKLYLNLVGDRMWWADSYHAGPIDPGSKLVQELASFNLPVEPMVCTVGPTLVRQDDDPPNIAGITAIEPEGPQVWPIKVADGHVYVNDGGKPLELWTTDGDQITHLFRQDYTRDLYVRLGDTWRVQAGRAVRLDRNGEPTGVMMSCKVSSLPVPLRWDTAVLPTD